MIKKQEEHSILNLLRFLAAFWVLVFHAQMHFGRVPELSLLEPLIGQGVVAMTLFFMLSGFVLSLRYKNFGNPGAIKRFFSARIARLYPVYVFMGLVTIWSIPFSFDTFVIPAQGLFLSVIWAAALIAIFVFALQAWLPSLFSVWNFNGSWSLSVEAFFYSLFPFMRTRFNAWSDRALMLLCFALLCLAFGISFSLLISLNSKQTTSLMFYVMPVFRLPEFLFGVVVFIVAVERKILGARTFFFSILLMTIGLIAIYLVGNLPGNLEYGPLFMPIFAAMFVFSLNRRLPAGINGFVNYLGHISYCVYIVQFGTVPVFKKILDGQGVGDQWLIFIAVNLVVAIAVHHGVEKFCYSRVRGYVDRRFGLTGVVQ